MHPARATVEVVPLIDADALVEVDADGVIATEGRK